MCLNTCSVSQHDVILSAVTHPLSAAGTQHVHQSRVLAVWCIQILEAQRDTGDTAVHTAAQLPARGHEHLTLLVPHAQVFIAKHGLPCEFRQLKH